MVKPHRVLAPHYNDDSEKQAFLRNLFDDAAPQYEGIAKWGWFGSGHWYRSDALRRAGMRAGMRVLDVASGTGPTARAIREIVGSDDLLTCLDPSAGMIAESKKLLACEHIQAGAEAIPLPDGRFDFVVMGFALRHVDDLSRAFREFYRVAAPGGKVLILDLSVPRAGLRRFAFKLYFQYTLPFLTRVFTRSRPAACLMSYFWETLDNMTEKEVVVEALKEAGFRKVACRTILGMFIEYEAERTASLAQ